jgi:hypothetical protein
MTFMRDKARTAPVEALASDFQKFIYELARFGLHVAKAYVVADREPSAANDKGQPERDSRGRFVKRRA